MERGYNAEVGRASPFQRFVDIGMALLRCRNDLTTWKYKLIRNDVVASQAMTSGKEGDTPYRDTD